MSPGEEMVEYPTVWDSVAERIATHLAAGRRHLLTEDLLRWATVEELESRGVKPDQLVIEQHLPETGGKLDLVVAGDPPTVIEFKFPRDSRTGFSPDTMTLGELLKDVYRLGELKGFGERWAVMLLNDRLCNYLLRRTDCRWTFAPGERLEFTPDGFRRLPPTASGRLRSWQDVTVSAYCTTCRELDGLRLVAYRLDRPDVGGSDN